MSGAMKAGLLFGLIGFVIAFTPLPVILGFIAVPSWLALVMVQIIPAFMLFGPLAGVLGGCAGYVGTRWSGSRTMHQGLVASGLAGGGLLLGILLFFGTIVFLLAHTPDLQGTLEQFISEQFAAQGGNSRIVVGSFTGLMLFAGLCTGIINLFIALLVGAWTSWLSRLHQEKR